jgi:hypothetical protein
MAHPLAEVSNFTYDVLNKEFNLTAKEKEYEVLLAAYLDDFWQKGVTLLPPTQGGLSGDLSNLFERRYVFRNIIKEVVTRVVGAFYGKAPNWRFQVGGQDIAEESPDLVPVAGEEPPAPAPTPESDNTLPTKEELADIDKALSLFFVRRNVAEEMGKAFAFRLAFGRGSWRLYIPAKYKRVNKAKATANEPNIEEDGSQPVGEKGDPKDFVPFDSIAEAIHAMRVEFVPPTQGRLLDDGGELFSLVKYQVRQNWETHEAKNVIEFSFVDNSQLTWIGTIGEQSGISKLIDANLSSPFDLGGLTTLGEFKGQPYVSHALYKNNQLCNLALTCAGFSLVDNGFGEMVLTNVQLETKTVTGPDGTKQEVPINIKRGGGAIQNLIGIDKIDEKTGTVTKETPGVHFREPSAMTAFKDGYDLGYVACLQEAGQLYALITGDATASGESRIQALADFILKVNPYKSEVDEEGSDLMTAVLLWASELSAKPLKGYRVVYDSRMFVSALSDAEKTTVISMRKDGTISRETERVLLGIDDPALENELILREQREPVGKTTIDDLSERADLCLKYLGLGIDQETIYETLGFTEEQINKIKQRASDEAAALAQQIADANAAAQREIPPGGGQGA